MPDKAEKIIDETMQKLGEHFDSVIILCSVFEDGVTRSRVRRVGNYYAAKGLLTEWLENEKNNEAATAIAEKLKED